MVEKIFENKTKYTNQEYQKFLKSHEKEYGLSELAYALFNIIFFSFCLILALINKEFRLSVILLTGIIVYTWYKLIRPTNKVKEQEKSKKIVRQYVNKYDFYKHYFKVKNVEGEAQTFYFKIYRVIETDTNFYIYISKEYAFLISKKGFIGKTSEEFSNFIKKKASLKYKNRTSKA